MDENNSPIDHFPGVLRHLSSERLMQFAKYYTQLISGGSDEGFIRDRAKQCQQEIEHRGALMRRRQSRLVA